MVILFVISKRDFGKCMWNLEDEKLRENLNIYKWDGEKSVARQHNILQMRFVMRKLENDLWAEVLEFGTATHYYKLLKSYHSWNHGTTIALSRISDLMVKSECSLLIWKDYLIFLYKSIYFCLLNIIITSLIF